MPKGRSLHNQQHTRGPAQTERALADQENATQVPSARQDRAFRHAHTQAGVGERESKPLGVAQGCVGAGRGGSQPSKQLPTVPRTQTRTHTQVNRGLPAGPVTVATVGPITTRLSGSGLWRTTRGEREKRGWGGGVWEHASSPTTTRTTDDGQTVPDAHTHTDHRHAHKSTTAADGSGVRARAGPPMPRHTHPTERGGQGVDNVGHFEKRGGKRNSPCNKQGKGGSTLHA